MLWNRWVDIGMCALLAAVLLGGCAAAANRPLQLISGSEAVYPRDAREDGIEGHVVVRYDISVDGRVMRAQVVKAEPPGVFDAAALAAVRSWVFNPAIVDGEPQPETGRESRLTFKLGGDDDYADY